MKYLFYYILGSIILILALIYFYVKSQINRFCYNIKINGFTLSDISLISLTEQGQNFNVSINLIILNNSTLNLKIKDFNIVIFDKGKQLLYTEKTDIFCASSSLNEFNIAAVLNISNGTYETIKEYLFNENGITLYGIAKFSIFGLSVSKNIEIKLNKNLQKTTFIC